MLKKMSETKNGRYFIEEYDKSKQISDYQKAFEELRNRNRVLSTDNNKFVEKNETNKSRNNKTCCCVIL